MKKDEKPTNAQNIKNFAKGYVVGKVVDQGVEFLLEAAKHDRKRAEKLVDSGKIWDENRDLQATNVFLERVEKEAADY